MRIAHYVGSDVTKRTPPTLHTPCELIDSSLIDSKAAFHALIDHLERREFRETALLLRALVYSCAIEHQSDIRRHADRQRKYRSRRARSPTQPCWQ